MNVRKIVGLLVVAFLIFFIITQPDAAASVLSSLAATLRGWANNLGHFISRTVA